MTLKKTFLKSLLNLLQYYFYVLLVWLSGMRDLSSPTRGQTCPICIGSRVITTGLPGKSLSATLDIIYQLPSIMAHANLFSDSVILFLTILHLLNIVVIFGQTNIQHLYHSVQFSSVAQSCPTLCDPVLLDIRKCNSQQSVVMFYDSVQFHSVQLLSRV